MIGDYIESACLAILLASISYYVGFYRGYREAARIYSGKIF